MLRRINLIAIATLALLAAPSWAESAVTYRELGLRYRDQGDFPAAITALEKAVELDPANLAGRVNLGWILHLAGQDRQAARALEQAIAYDPSHVQTFNALGIVYLVNDDLASAVLAHTWATILEPGNEIAYYNLSLAYQRLEQFPWAIAAAKKAAALEPENPHPWVALAIAYGDDLDPQAAQQAYRQAIAVDERYRDREFLNYLTEFGFSLEQTQQAQRLLDSLD